MKATLRWVVLLVGPLLSTAAGAAAPEALPSSNLHNLFRITTNVYSGGSPETPSAFDELKRLRITTVISVDGARPDVETARQHGLRYVHLPIGYDGIPTNRWAELLKSTQLTTGSIYIHCHHGKHRGPAAAAILCQAASGWSTHQALAWLKQAGTSAEYAGLYRSVAQFQFLDTAILAALPPLPEVATTSSTVDAMVAIDGHMEHLKAAQKAAWKNVPGHPDLVPRHEALLLWEQLRELQRLPDATQRPEDYQEMMANSEKLAADLRSALQGPEPEKPRADSTLQALSQFCVACHKPYRN